jgi:hypothetical protein
MTLHIMIDLETLGTDPATAPIIQIAAVPFRLDEDGPADRPRPFSEQVRAVTNAHPPHCRRVSFDTVAWWAETNPGLLVKLLKDPAAMSLSGALGNLSIWFTAIHERVEGVWANGATFDISMLEAAYRDEGMLCPWDFRAVRDVRTMAMIAHDHDVCWTGGTITHYEATGQKHDAQVDCLRQIRLVQQTWQRRIIPLDQPGLTLADAAGPLGQDAG